MSAAPTSVSARPPPARGCSQDTYQDVPSHPPASANTSPALGIRALPGRRATLLQLAAEVPAAVLAELLHLTPATATRWTRDAAGDWSRYAADLASKGDHQRRGTAGQQIINPRLFDSIGTLLVTSKKWVARRYFGRFNKLRNDRWVFGARDHVVNDRGDVAHLVKFSWTPIVRHQLVVGRASLG